MLTSKQIYLWSSEVHVHARWTVPVKWGLHTCTYVKLPHTVLGGLHLHVGVYTMYMSKCMHATLYYAYLYK